MAKRVRGQQADGSEYRGDYGLSVAKLRQWHRPRLTALAEAEPDLLACETIPCLAEVEALVTELSELDLPAWISLTVVGDRTRLGESADEAYAMAAEVPQVVALGANCCDPGGAADVVKAVAGRLAHLDRGGRSVHERASLAGRRRAGRRRLLPGHPRPDRRHAASAGRAGLSSRRQRWGESGRPTVERRDPPFAPETSGVCRRSPRRANPGVEIDGR
jgi:hypothetical protein